MRRGVTRCGGRGEVQVGGENSGIENELIVIQYLLYMCLDHHHPAREETHRLTISSVSLEIDLSCSLLTVLAKAFIHAYYWRLLTPAGGDR